jgi:hypothetical protein
MTVDTAVAPIVGVALEAFADRGLRIVDVETPAPGVHLVRFDLDGHRLHLVTDEQAPQTFALDLRDALYIDEDRMPGVIGATLELVNFLHARIHHVRFYLTDAGSEDAVGVASRAGRGTLAESSVDCLLTDPGGVSGRREALVSLSFTAPLFDDPARYWRGAFEMGIDTLLYALGRLYDELRLAGYPVAGTERLL